MRRRTKSGVRCNTAAPPPTEGTVVFVAGRWDERTNNDAPNVFCVRLKQRK
jgi:hypothetical protein